MSHHDIESAYTLQEQEDNSRVDALAIFSLVIIVIAMLVFFVSS